MKKIIILFLLSIFLFSCSHQSSASYISKENIVIGTLCSVKIYDNQNRAILEECFNKLEELENTLSINKANTTIDEVNANAGVKPVKVSKEILDLVEYSFKYSEISGGLFDISIGPLVKLWHIGFDDEQVPSSKEIEAAKSKINYKDIIIDHNESTIYLKNKGMMLDFGAIAKGYAADSLNKILDENNVKSAIIDLGGNIFAKGKKLDDSNWLVGVQDPDEYRGDSLGNIEIENKSLVTSGIYEKYIEGDGAKYHHILNPFTGYPEENELLSVTVISDLSIDGDALSTTLFLMGKEKGLEYAESRDDIDVIYVMKNYDVFLSSGVKDIFTIANSKYKLK